MDFYPVYPMLDETHPINYKPPFRSNYNGTFTINFDLSDQNFLQLNTLYLCKIAIQIYDSSEEPRVDYIYRWVLTSGLYNNAYLNTSPLFVKDFNNFDLDSTHKEFKEINLNITYDTSISDPLVDKSSSDSIYSLKQTTNTTTFKKLTNKTTYTYNIDLNNFKLTKVNQAFIPNIIFDGRFTIRETPQVTLTQGTIEKQQQGNNLPNLNAGATASINNTGDTSVKLVIEGNSELCTNKENSSEVSTNGWFFPILKRTGINQYDPDDFEKVFGYRVGSNETVYDTIPRIGVALITYSRNGFAHYTSSAKIDRSVETFSARWHEQGNYGTVAVAMNTADDDAAVGSPKSRMGELNTVLDGFDSTIVFGMQPHNGQPSGDNNWIRNAGNTDERAVSYLAEKQAFRNDNQQPNKFYKDFSYIFIKTSTNTTGSKYVLWNKILLDSSSVLSRIDPNSNNPEIPGYKTIKVMLNRLCKMFRELYIQRTNTNLVLYIPTINGTDCSYVYNKDYPVNAKISYQFSPIDSTSLHIDELYQRNIDQIVQTYLGNTTEANIFKNLVKVELNAPSLSNTSIDINREIPGMSEVVDKLNSPASSIITGRYAVVEYEVNNQLDKKLVDISSLTGNIYKYGESNTLEPVSLDGMSISGDSLIVNMGSEDTVKIPDPPVSIFHDGVTPSNLTTNYCITSNSPFIEGTFGNYHNTFLTLCGLKVFKGGNSLYSDYFSTTNYYRTTWI